MRLLLSFLLFIITPFALSADLTSKDVQQWLESMPKLQQWITNNQDKIPEPELTEDSFNMDAVMAQSIAHIKKAGLYDELSAETKAVGYASVEDWANKSQLISMAYIALSQGDSKLSREQLAMQKQQLEQMTMADENKDMMLKMLEGALAMLDAVDSVPAANKAAVEPYLEQIAQQIGEED